MVNNGNGYGNGDGYGYGYGGRDGNGYGGIDGNGCGGRDGNGYFAYLPISDEAKDLFTKEADIILLTKYLYAKTKERTDILGLLILKHTEI